MYLVNKGNGSFVDSRKMSDIFPRGILLDKMSSVQLGVYKYDE